MVEEHAQRQVPLETGKIDLEDLTLAQGKIKVIVTQFICFFSAK